MRTIFLSLLCLISTLHLGATEKAEISVDSLFAAGRYREAAAALEEEIKTSGESSTRYANLGNCYYLLGDLGHAVLSYERATLLDPRDKAIAEARAVLIKKTIDKLPDAESWFTLTGAKVAYALPLTALLPLALVLFALAIGSCVAFALGRTRRGKRIAFYAALGRFVQTDPRHQRNQYQAEFIDGGDLRSVAQLQGFEVGEPRCAGGEAGENQEGPISSCKPVHTLPFAGIGQEQDQRGKDDQRADESGKI